MNGMTDKYRQATAAGVLIVATIAAVVSYEHIRDLSLAYGQSQISAFLMPLSVDGLVATSSVVMLRAARVKIASPWTARAGLLFGVGATVVANIASGLPVLPGPVPRGIIAGWPAIAFVIAAEIAIGMTRVRARAATQPAPEPRQGDAPAARQASASDRARRNARAKRLLLANPGMELAEVAQKAGVSKRTASRIKSGLPTPLRPKAAAQ